MKVLVTGASGMLGQALMTRFGRRHDVTGISRSGKNGLTPGELSDAAQVRALFDKTPFELVVHSAAYSDVDGCERDPAQAYASNALSSKNLAENCRARRVPYIYVSTDYVFDGQKNTPYQETDPVFPVNIYGMTKLAGEHFARDTAPVSAIVRTSWLFGAENPANFVNWAIRTLREKKAISVLDDQQDSPTYVEDLAEAIEKIAADLADKALRSPDKSVRELFQVCNGGVTTRHGMTLLLRDLLGLKDAAVSVTDRGSIPRRLAVRPAYAAMSTAHYESAFGAVLRPWQDSLGDFVKNKVLCAS